MAALLVLGALPTAANADKSSAKPDFEKSGPEKSGPERLAAVPVPRAAVPQPTNSGLASGAGWAPVVTRHRVDLLESNPHGLLAWIATALLALGAAVTWRLGYSARLLRPIMPVIAPILARLPRRTRATEPVHLDLTTADALGAAVSAGHLHVTAVTDQIEAARQDLLRLDDAALRAVLGEELYQICQSLDVIAKEPPQTAAGWSQVHHMLHGQSADIRRIRRIAGSVQPPAVTDASSASLFETLPGDKDMAYAVLGLNSEASEAAAKKVVDGLRQTWHPDTARDEADRAIREVRMKQINVAWDLIRTRAA